MNHQGWLPLYPFSGGTIALIDAIHIESIIGDGIDTIKG